MVENLRAVFDKEGFLEDEVGKTRERRRVANGSVPVDRDRMDEGQAAHNVGGVRTDMNGVPSVIGGSDLVVDHVPFLREG